MNNNAFIILDRDGVINKDSPDFIKTPEEWQPLPNSLKAIAELTNLGYQIIVATNQSGLARNYYTLEILNQIHQKMRDEIRQAGGDILDIFFCPHGPDEGCLCRKPASGLYDLMLKKYPHINFSKTYSVGDSLRDLQAAQKAGSLPILVQTGNGVKTLQKIQTDTALSYFKSVPIFEDLYSFSTFLRQ
jgi:D-glycero-D-manno-heptose 1,7-bisphosphate phosphatase